MPAQQRPSRTGTGSDAAGATVSPQTMIRPARELAGISLRELARRVGVSVGTMSAIETGKTSASAERLELIVAELGTTVELLAAAPVPPDAAPVDEFDWRTYPERHLDPVLSAAIECFVRTGYHGATMRTIAAQAQISVPGVYHHYASKQALLVAGFDLAIAELTAHLYPARDEGTTPAARLDNLCRALVLFAAVRRDLAQIVVTEPRNVAAPDDARVHAFIGELISLLRNEISAGRTDHSFAADDPGAAARAVLSLCLSVCQWDSTATDAQSLAAQYSAFALSLARNSSPPAGGSAVR